MNEGTVSNPIDVYDVLCAPERAYDEKYSPEIIGNVSNYSM